MYSFVGLLCDVPEQQTIADFHTPVHRCSLTLTNFHHLHEHLKGLNVIEQACLIVVHNLVTLCTKHDD
jgi:hypothetical protein